MNVRTKILSAAVMLSVFLTACGADNENDFPKVAMNIQLTSAVFAAGQPIPAKFTCDGNNVSPALDWTGAPANTKSFALIVDDPDAPAGIWVHWVIWNLPASATSLAEGTQKSDSLSDGAKQGVNDFKKIGYDGPCPPRGKPHRYFFKLYALDTVLDLQSGASKKDLLATMQGHVLTQGQLIGTYQRQ